MRVAIVVTTMLIAMSGGATADGGMLSIEAAFDARDSAVPVGGGVPVAGDSTNRAAGGASASSDGEGLHLNASALADVNMSIARLVLDLDGVLMAYGVSDLTYDTSLRATTNGGGECIVLTTKGGAEIRPHNCKPFR